MTPEEQRPEYTFEVMHDRNCWFVKLNGETMFPVLGTREMRLMVNAILEKLEPIEEWCREHNPRLL